MNASSHIVIIAGEESGDQHAAECVRVLCKRHPNLRVTGIGGQHMSDAGVILISDLARYGVTGLTEVFRHLWVIRKAFLAIKKHLRDDPPDLLILVDYPGFNLRLARFAKEVLKIKVLYYISPQIWAWKANRIHRIRRYVDQMAVILPFEKKIYQEAQIPVAFVGHPLMQKISGSHDIDVLKQQLKLPLNTPILALLPGSRHNEIKHHMPVLRDVMIQLNQRYPHLHFVIPIARSLSKDVIADYLRHNTQIPVHFINQQATEAAACSDFIIVASGTASLECALLAKPMCIIYKASLFTYILACQLMKVKYFGLCNLLLNRMVVPELLQYDCNANALIAQVIKHIEHPKQSQSMQTQLQQLRHVLSQQHADIRLEDLIEQSLESIE